MKWLVVACLLAISWVDPPFKPTDEFEVKVDLQIKSKPITGGEGDAKIDEMGRVENKRNENLPYLALHVKFLKLPHGEVKARIRKKDGTGTTKKVKVESVIRLDLGFMADIKGGLASTEYNIILYDAKKKAVNHIHIFIGADGTYYVNDILCGKF